MIKLTLKYIAISFLSVIFLNPLANSSLPDFTFLAEEYSSSVVNVSVVRKQKEKENQSGQMRQSPPGSPFDFFNDERFRDFFRNQPQKRMPQRTAGSGFIISDDGFIVTNNHVVEEAETIKITLSNDEVYDAEVIGLDPRMDLALLKINPEEDLPYVSFGNSDNSKVGEWVVAIGNPFGLGGTVTAGIISALGRNIGSGPYDHFIQTDAPINKGNSGGPLFNMNGKVIGVNTMIYSQTGGSVGIGFSIPSDLVKPVIDQLKKYGETRRGWLGVMIQNVTEELAKDMDLDEAKGALVQQVVKDGPADKEGIEEGDVILAFLSRSYHESVKNPNAFVLTEAGDNQEKDLSDEFLFYSRPKGTYKEKDTEKVLLDFYLVNTEISPNGNKVRATIDETTFLIDEWVPYYIEGLSNGETQIKLELINSDGNLIDVPFNPSIKTINIEK